LGDTKRQLPAGVAQDLIKFFKHEDIAGLSQDTFQTVIQDARKTLSELQGQVFVHYGLE